MPSRPFDKSNDKSKQLSAEDAAIWRRVARTVNSYETSSLSLPSKKRSSEGALKKTMPIRPISAGSAVQNPRIKAPPLYSFAKSGSVNSGQNAPQIAQDKKTRRGKISIDRKVDLHDLTQDQAYGQLCRALKAGFNQGQSCILVVTGKGSLSQRASGGGVLRRNLPLWLASPQLRSMVARYASAHIKHGGSGAYYVFLKKPR